MDKLGEIFLDNDGYVNIRWTKELGKMISENDLQDTAGDICDSIAGVLNKVDY